MTDEQHAAEIRVAAARLERAINNARLDGLTVHPPEWLELAGRGRVHKLFLSRLFIARVIRCPDAEEEGS